jgi:hypothetical protein
MEKIKDKEIKTTEDFELLELIGKSEIDLQNGNLISHEEVKRLLKFENKKWKENA